MSMSIDGSMNSLSIMSQLQQMQQNLNRMAAGAQSMPPAVNPDAQNKLSSAAETANIEDAASAAAPAGSAGDSVGLFASMLKDAFENVNILQNESAAMQSRFDVGDRSVTLADVMLASQKSSISFEATLQVRNKMVDAYKTIMQMQI